MRSIVVTNREELKSAKKQGYEEIVVSGNLAKNLKKSMKILKLGPVALGILGVSIVATPITGGITYCLAAPIAMTAGVEVSTIIAVGFIGVGLILSIFKGYEEISFSGVPPKLILRKKSKD